MKNLFKQIHLSSKNFIRWEMILLYVLLTINVSLMCLLPDLYFSQGTISSILKSIADLSPMVLGMVFVLIIGEIDVSVASVMLLCSVVMGLLYGAGIPDFLAVFIGIFVGALCGFFNGVLIACFKIPSVIVTIATMMFFRGLVQVMLNVNNVSTFPEWFKTLSWQDGLGIPYSILFFLILSMALGFVLHFTTFGRKLYMLGNNKVASRYSGLKVTQITIGVFVLMGVCAAVSGIVFAGRLGGITSSMATGYELQVIAIAVLGGVSTNGGKGNIFGPVIAFFIMAFLGKALNLYGIHANIQKIIIGLILLLAVISPILGQKLFTFKHKKGSLK